MLIINILLIILFFIILFYDINLVEGQGVDDGSEDMRMYSFNDLLTDFDTFINKINLSNYLGFDLKNFMETYNSQCVDTDEPISAEFKNQNLHEIVEDENIINTEINILNTENIINRFVSPFGIEIKGDHDTSNVNALSFEIGRKSMCSLVDTIYNNNVSGSLVKSITEEYGNCFIESEGPNKFIESCQQSCHLQEKKLPACHEHSREVQNCDELDGIDNSHRELIHIKKDNGLYYNCVPDPDRLSPGDPHYEEKSCIPKNNMCEAREAALDPDGDGVTCYIDEGGRCEEHHMFHLGGHYNCHADHEDFQNGSHACVRVSAAGVTKPCIDGRQLINYASLCNQNI